MHVLLLATTTGYQVRSFGEAAGRLGVQIVFATDRCHVLEDPWLDQAVPIRFHREHESVRTILKGLAGPIAGVLAVGDRPTVIAARIAAELGLPWHPPAAAAISRSKLLTRERLREAGERTPWFRSVPLDADAAALAASVAFPCVVKPLALSGSRGVMRADTPSEFTAAFGRLRRLLLSRDVRAEQNPDHDRILIEGYVAGVEVAVEGVLEHGTLVPLAIFDKPDPLEGPFFEETLYVTPSRLALDRQAAVLDAVGRACRAIGLRHGPIHAECRVAGRRITVLEVAARPIGGLCAGCLRFQADGSMTLEELLLRHATGERVGGFRRETAASGVMMIPIPEGGVYRRVHGLDEARAVPGIDDVRITAKPDQRLVPLPEGASYLGFIFARAATPDGVEQALRTAHRQLRFVIDPALALTSG